MYTKVKNLQWANEEHTKINCEVNFDHIPDEFVKFTASADDKEYYSKEIFNNAILGKFGNIVEFEKIIVPLSQLKENKKQQINIEAGNSRSKYITVIPGQESTYQFKLHEAQNYVIAVDPNNDDYPFLLAEATAINTSILDLANSILQTWNNWRPLAAQIESIRRKAMIEIDNAKTEQELMNITATFP